MRNRISVTHLDSYQYFLDSDIPESELYERIFGEFRQTPAMAAGTTLHTLLELGIDPFSIKSDVFSYEQKCEISGDLTLGEPSEREKKHVSKLVEGVDLVGVIDVETPYLVIDHKLTGRYDPERYFKSWQWRAYLTMRNKQHFRYQVFECIPVKEYGQTVQIKGYHTLDMFAYEGMESEVISIVTDLNNLINKWRSEGLSCERAKR